VSGSPVADPAIPAPSATTEGRLRRDIGVFVGATIVVNCTIGTGIFQMPAETLRLAGSLPLSLLSWVCGGLLALSGALSFAELSAAMPRSGGICEFLRRAYGPRVAFVFGWAELVLLIPTAVGGLAKLAAEAAAPLLGLPPEAARWLAMAFLLLCVGQNLLAVRDSARSQAVLSALKYGGVAALAVLGLCAPVAGPAVTAAQTTLHPTLTGFFAALVPVLWTYDGWSNLAGLAGEVRQPGRTLPRALVAGTLAIIAVYLAANLGYARVLGPQGLLAASNGRSLVGEDVASAVLGGRGRLLFDALIAVCGLGWE
jgi:amino acid transporter